MRLHDDMKAVEIKKGVRNRLIRKGFGHIDIGTIYPSRPIDFHEELGVDQSIPLGNMSLCPLEDDKYLVSVRQFNYILETGSAKCKMFGDFYKERANFFVICDREFNFLWKVECDRLEMMEDLRILRFGDAIQASGTDISYARGQMRMSAMNFCLKDNKIMELSDRFVFPWPREKNYVPVEDGKGIFISDMNSDSLKIACLWRKSEKKGQRCVGIVPYRGSTQLLRYRDGYVALVHRRNKHEFTNAFAFFDKSLLQCRISDEFTVFKEKSPVNFCCGMAIEGDTAIVPFCVHDRYSYLFRLPLPDFAMTARWRS